jgi:hypothetical protein
MSKKIGVEDVGGLANPGQIKAGVSLQIVVSVNSANELKKVAAEIRANFRTERRMFE